MGVEPLRKLIRQKLTLGSALELVGLMVGRKAHSCYGRRQKCLRMMYTGSDQNTRCATHVGVRHARRLKLLSDRKDTPVKCTLSWSFFLRRRRGKTTSGMYRYNFEPDRKKYKNPTPDS